MFGFLKMLEVNKQLNEEIKEIHSMMRLLNEAIKTGRIEQARMWHSKIENSLMDISNKVSALSNSQAISLLLDWVDGRKLPWNDWGPMMLNYLSQTARLI